MGALEDVWEVSHKVNPSLSTTIINTINITIIIIIIIIITTTIIIIFTIIILFIYFYFNFLIFYFIIILFEIFKASGMVVECELIQQACECMCV